jgi:hypothetical protein
MRVLFSALCFTLFFGCFSSNNVKESSNTSLVVTYEGKEVHRREPKKPPRWIGAKKFVSLEKEKSAIIVFGAEWCRACETLRVAIKQAKLKEPVYYVNIDNPWAQGIIADTGIKNIPIMFYLVDGKAKIAKVGTNRIVMWLLINIESN